MKNNGVQGKINAKGEIVIREEEAKIVRRIYDEFLAGQNTQFISDMLNANGVPARHKGAIWYNKTVINILQNEKYCGNVLFQIFCSVMIKCTPLNRQGVHNL